MGLGRQVCTPCGCSPCVAYGYCLHIKECCGTNIVGQSVTITPSGGSADTGTTDADGKYCHTFDTKVGFHVSTTYHSCVIEWDSTLVECSWTQDVSFCWADVTLEAYTLAGGDATGEQVVFRRFDGDCHGNLRSASSCTENPVKVRSVHGVGCPGTVSGCADAANVVLAGIYGCPPVPTMDIGVSSLKCDNTPTNFLWECVRKPDWCCETTTLRVGGLPFDGDTQWTGRDPCSEDPIFGRVSTCCANCRAAADMTFASMGFLAKTVQFDATLYYFWPDGGGTTRHDFTISTVLTLVCEDGVPVYRSDPISVTLPLGTYYCNGVNPPHTYNATLIRVRCPWVPSDYLCRGQAEIEIMATDFTPICEEYLLFGCGATPPDTFRWFLGLTSCPRITETSSDWYVQCCDGEDAYGDPTPCDHHVDWSFERDPTDLAHIPRCDDVSSGSGCVIYWIYGTATAVGPL